jgi:3'(2'), 5'-bisphosphate nucleotidase
MDDPQLATHLAATAGRLLMTLREDGLLDGKPLGAAGDIIAHEYLVRTLGELRPEDGLLSEEAAADPARLSKERVWIVDPLDGTREYAERRDDWAVHVALCIGGEARIGAVALPALGLVLDTATAAPPPAPAGPLKFVVSRSRPPAQASRAAEAMGAELVAMGSAGAKAMAVVRGKVHAYIHAGGQYEWDSAAPVAVAAASGLHVSRLDGAPLVYNCADTYLPDVLICRPELARDLLRLVGK